MEHTVRKQVVISSNIDAEITRVANEKATTPSEIVRRALLLYLSATEFEKRGLTLGFTRDIAGLETEVVGL